MDRYQPISLNPELPYEQSLLSPVHLLTKRPSLVSDALSNQNILLKQELSKLLSQLNFRRQKNSSLHEEVARQEKKIRSWKNCYEKAEEQYCKKVELMEKLSQQIKQLKGEKLATDPEPVENLVRMSCDQEEDLDHISIQLEDSFKLTQRLQNKKVNSYMPKMNRVNSIALEKKKSKRKQALSLTHLRKYHENY